MASDTFYLMNSSEMPIPVYNFESFSNLVNTTESPTYTAFLDTLDMLKLV